MTASAIYSMILQEDAVYQQQQKEYRRNVKNARRAQRKAKQAQRMRQYDSFWTVH